MESYQLAELACILKPSMTGVLNRLERDGIIRRSKPAHDQRRMYVALTEKGQQCFVSMADEMENNYRKIQEKYGEEKMQLLFELLADLNKIKP